MKRILASAAILALAAVALPLMASTPATAGGNSANAKTCQKNGWQSYVRADGTPFTSEQACTSYGAQGTTPKLPQTATFTSTAPSSVAVGADPYAVSATSTSGLPVAITLDATSTGCTLTGSSVTFPAVGTCVIDANQAGNTTYGAAAQVQQHTTISAAACTGTPTTRLTPTSGVKDDTTLMLDASGSSDPCGRPLVYFWTCGGTQSDACETFLVAAVNGSISTYGLPLGGFDEYTITVTACLQADTNNCGDAIERDYTGQAV
jgi:hypothetical protein